MSNYIPRLVRHTPRMADLEAYDVLPQSVRDELNYGTAAWSAYWCVRQMKRGLSQESVVRSLRASSEKEALKPWVDVWGKRTPSPTAWVASFQPRPDRVTERDLFGD